MLLCCPKRTYKEFAHTVQTGQFDVSSPEGSRSRSGSCWGMGGTIAKVKWRQWCYCASSIYSVIAVTVVNNVILHWLPADRRYTCHGNVWHGATHRWAVEHYTNLVLSTNTSKHKRHTLFNNSDESSNSSYNILLSVFSVCYKQTPEFINQVELSIVDLIIKYSSFCEGEIWHHHKTRRSSRKWSIRPRHNLNKNFGKRVNIGDLLSKGSAVDSSWM